MIGDTWLATSRRPSVDCALSGSGGGSAADGNTNISFTCDPCAALSWSEASYESTTPLFKNHLGSWLHTPLGIWARSGARQKAPAMVSGWSAKDTQRSKYKAQQSNDLQLPTPAVKKPTHCYPVNLHRWPSDPEINGFPGVVMGHPYVHTHNAGVSNKEFWTVIIKLLWHNTQQMTLQFHQYLTHTDQVVHY